MIKKNVIREAKKIIAQHGGMIRTSEALKKGIHPRTLYSLRDTGEIEQISRGLYRLSTLKPISNPDLVTVACRFPKAVICLMSALSYHGLTTEIPHSVYIALEKGAEEPIIDYPPLSVHRFSKKSFEGGIDVYDIDGVSVRIYSPEKTLADCLKFRDKIGIDIFLDALKLYKSKNKFRVNEVLKYARICRVENVIKPYLEVLL